MLVLSHRGYWKSADEKNMPVAFERSFSLGFGTETDVRDLDGRLVVSHDPPRMGCLTLADMLLIYQQHGGGVPLALNIKSDGLQAQLKEQLGAAAVSDYFVFDMSIPDCRGYLSQKMPIYTRQSELEREPCFYEDAAGVWLDAFDGEWYDGMEIARHLDNGKKVCVVSPDLHKREYKALWQSLKNWGVAERDGIMLCTDFPEEAQSFFHGQD